MTVGIRPVNLEAEQDELLGVLERNLTALEHARRFRWLYRENPFRATWSWFVYEKSSRKVVGAASVFPRAMWVGGKVRVCGQVGDFAIDASHRSLGPAVMLQRATFQPVNEGSLALCYDCPPDDRGVSTFHRLGMQPDVVMHRYAKLLRVDRQVERRLGRGRLGASIASLGNRVVSRRHFRGRGAAGVEISVHEGPFDEEFSWLDQRMACDDVIRSRRAAEDLNWRYREDPLHEYRVITARRAGELVAFIVFAVLNGDAYIIDVGGDASIEVCGSLCEAVVKVVGTSSVQTLQAVVAEGSALARSLRAAGFAYRSEAAVVVAYARPGGDVAEALAGRSTWQFRHADILA